MRGGCVAIVGGVAACLFACGLGTNGLMVDPPSTSADADAARQDERDSPTAPETSDDDEHAADVDASTSQLTLDGSTTPDGSIVPEGSPPEAGPPLVGRWNIDGPTYVGVEYPGTWIAAPVPGICGPYPSEPVGPLHGTSDTPLFEGEVYGNPAICAAGSGLAPGMYRVSLLFAEIYWGPGCPGGGGVGSRVFDIVLEGTTVLSNFDIFAASGGCLASTTSDAGVPVVRTFDVAVTDGTLDISLPATVDNGALSALEVLGPL